jgi:hypothetical protein
VYFLSKKDPVDALFSPIQKLLMKLVHEHQDTYGETFYMIYRVSFSHNYHTEKSAVQACFTLSIYHCKWEHKKDF